MTIKKIIPVLLLAISSCTYDERSMPTPAIVAAADSTSVIDSTVSYSMDIKPIIITYCFGMGAQQCHVTNTNQGSNGDFTTYAGLKAKVDNGAIATRVFNPLGGMPPSYSTSPQIITPVELKKFKDWVALGAPDN